MRAGDVFAEAVTPLPAVENEFGRVNVFTAPDFGVGALPVGELFIDHRSRQPR